MASPCFLLTPLQGFDARDVGGAGEKIFYYIRRYRDKKVIYFNGWSGFGVAPVLRSIEQELRSIKAKKTPPELCLDKIVYIDCSAWESKRVMQRKIAEELKLGPETMAVLDMQDEDDDFNGVDHGSRDVIPSVSQVIARTLVDKKFMMIFLNGSDDEVDVTRFGITPGYCDHIILWTFKRRSLTIHNRREEIGRKLRYTQLLLYTRSLASELTSSQFQSLLREEAANIVARQPWVRGIDLIMLMESCLYELFLQCSFHRITGFAWVAHAPNYWTCDGIIKAGDVTRQIIDRLHQEIRWVCDAPLLGSVFAKLMEDPEAQFFVFKDDISFPKKRPHRWVCVTSKNITAIDDTKDILESASSLFVAFEKSDNLQALPNGFLTHCSNLGVVILSWCAFSFISPPFLQCHRLRFLGLDHCTNVNTVGVENNTDYWVFLQSLWVLDLRYTEWDDIISEGKMEIMANLRELNIEGLMCWKLTSRLLRRLPYLQKLRIIKPTHEAKTTIDYYNSFVDKVDLEILDLSGNRDMENLPTSLSMAKSLEMLILDGCDGLENVVVPNGLPSSLRSFSFDGYGPATHWTSSLFKLHLESSEPKQLPHADNRDVKTSKISLQGCTQLENLFIRGLPNLVELDLSECPIKVLDLTTMVADVPLLKRLFLLGCENLRAIIWASHEPMKWIKLELLCIDTRPKRAHGFIRPSLAQYDPEKRKKLELHAILADARLARSLNRLVGRYAGRSVYRDIYFNIHFTSPAEYSGGVQLETTGKKMIEHSNQQHFAVVSRYGDVLSKIGDAPMLVFPQPPTQQFGHHIEISNGSHSLENELVRYDNLSYLMAELARSLHVHDASTSASMPERYNRHRLKWCRMERCPNIDTVFPSAAQDYKNELETVWISDLQKARSIWSKGSRSPPSFENLQHLHLRSCPRLQFVLPVWVASFPSLETLHIIHCGDLTHVFVLDEKYPEEIVTHGVPFPKLTTIHFHDLPKLQQICEVKVLAPKLKTIRIRGCFGLRRLPSLQGREPGLKKPTVEMEKDVWDALQWDGLAAGHHPDLFEPPVHSRYYRPRRLLRGTVLRYLLSQTCSAL